MHKLLKNGTYLGKKLFFNFFEADFIAPKSSHEREKQPVLEPDSMFLVGCFQSISPLTTVLISFSLEVLHSDILSGGI